MQLINTFVEPPIVTACYVTTSHAKWSAVRFYRKKGGTLLKQDTDSLSSVERGHVYSYRRQIDGRVFVHMPCKVMDITTGKLLHNLKSFSLIVPVAINPGTSKGHKNRKACLQDFCLNTSDYEVFSSRVLAIGGILIDGSTNHEDLIKLIETTIDDCADTLVEIQEFRSTTCMVTGPKNIADEEEYKTALSVVQELRDLVKSYQLVKLDIAKRLDTLSREVGKETAQTQVRIHLEKLQVLVTELESVDFTRMERELVHKHKMQAGKDMKSISIMRSLPQEIEELKKHFTWLEKLQTEGDSLVVDLAGVLIKLTPKGVSVVGDPGALKSYMGSVPAQEVERLGGRRKRVID